MEKNRLKKVYGRIITNSLDTYITNCREVDQAKSIFKVEVDTLEGFCNYILLTDTEINGLLKECRKNKFDQLEGEGVRVYYTGNFINGLQKS